MNSSVSFIEDGHTLETQTIGVDRMKPLQNKLVRPNLLSGCLAFQAALFGIVALGALGIALLLIASRGFNLPSIDLLYIGSAVLAAGYAGALLFVRRRLLKDDRKSAFPIIIGQLMILIPALIAAGIATYAIADSPKTPNQLASGPISNTILIILGAFIISAITVVIAVGMRSRRA